MVNFTRNAPQVAALAWPNGFSWAAWRESGNKLEAFQAFATAHRWLSRTGDTREELIRAANEVSARSDFLGLWTTEGLGYYSAVRALERKEVLGSLLVGSAHRLPERSMIPLHTGMGLALACDGLRCLAHPNRAADDLRCVVQFLQRSRESSLDGYIGVMLEALGLVAVLLRPTTLNTIDRLLAEVDAALPASLWHGVGRGLYFTPISLLPCTSAAWPSLDRALQDPPHEVGRRNALAGLAWALALVNVRNPEVWALFLKRYANRLPTPNTFANGVASAAAVWHAWAPKSDCLQRICSHRPRDGKDEMMPHWERHAQTQCQPEFLRAVEQLLRQNRVDELFRVPAHSNEETRV